MKMWGDSAHKLQDNSVHAKSWRRLTFLRDRDHTDPVASGAALTGTGRNGGRRRDA